MALIKCPECNKEVSDQAISCPHCGYPLKRNKRNQTQESNLPDFSKMEVILYRGVRKSLFVWTEIIGPILLIILIATGFILIFQEVSILRAIAVIWFIFSGLYLPIFIVMWVKIHNNGKLKHQNLYYDKDSQQFFLECWSRQIMSIDAHEDIRVGSHMIGFNETVVVHQGRRINTGFSTSNLNAANQRIRQIRESLNDK